jgi:putative endonuclease
MKLYPISHFKGFLAEVIAIIFLSLKLYKIRKWRYKSNYGEIDIIAQKGEIIAFIEVKRTRFNLRDWPTPSNYQLERIKNSAEIYLDRTGLADKGYSPRIDLITAGAWNLVLTHYKNITL